MITISWDMESEANFSHKGCENCNNGLGNDVHECELYENIREEPVEVELCSECLCAYANGDDLPEDCQNVFNI